MSSIVQVAANQAAAIQVAANQAVALQVAALQVAALQVAATRVVALHSEASEAARFVVGQDPEGRWVAIEVHGRAGGFFRSRKDAVDYAADETGHRPDAVILSGERIALPL